MTIENHLSLSYVDYVHCAIVSFTIAFVFVAFHFVTSRSFLILFSTAYAIKLLSSFPTCNVQLYINNIFIGNRNGLNGWRSPRLRR